MSKLEPQKQIPFEAFQLAYTPVNEQTKESMIKVNTLLGITTQPVGFDTANNMQSALHNEKYLAGIEISMTNNKRFTFAIRLTGQCRFGSEVPVIRNWNTGLMFPRSQYAGPRNPTDTFGGSPAGYVEEGFIAIQMALYKVFYCKPEMPKIYLQVSYIVNF